MGYQTPNIDRIAREGARFTDWYGQQSCTAGRAALVILWPIAFAWAFVRSPSAASPPAKEGRP